jgi:hypothetical protein
MGRQKRPDFFGPVVNTVEIEDEQKHAAQKVVPLDTESS